MERLVCLMMVLFVGVTNAGIIYQEDFSGDGSGIMNGTTPEIDNYGSGGHSWTSNAGFYTDGDVGGADGSALLPFVPQAGTVYELSADLSPVVGSTEWFGVGFTTNAIISPAGSNSNDRFSNSGGYAWCWHRDSTSSNQIVVTPGPNVGSYQLVGGQITDIPTPHTFTIVLDTTGTTWTTQLLLDGNAISNVLNLPSSAASNIKYVGITANLAGVEGNATVDNFELSEVPEPATLILLGLGSLLTIRSRR